MCQNIQEAQLPQRNSASDAQLTRCFSAVAELLVFFIIAQHRRHIPSSSTHVEVFRGEIFHNFTFHLYFSCCTRTWPSGYPLPRTAKNGFWPIISFITYSEKSNSIHFNADNSAHCFNKIKIHRKWQGEKSILQWLFLCYTERATIVTWIMQMFCFLDTTAAAHRGHFCKQIRLRSFAFGLLQKTY